MVTRYLRRSYSSYWLQSASGSTLTNEKATKGEIADLLSSHVLAAAAGRMRQSIRQQEFIARLGVSQPLADTR
jgi:hypothetical protein